MRINIIGQHPVPRPGLDGVMSLYEALWFSRLGDDVILYLPFPTEKKRDAFSTRAAGGFAGLERLGGTFSIEPVLHDGNALRPCDVTIWQSRDPDAWKWLYPIALQRSRVLTRNFSRLVPHGPTTLHPKVIEQLAEVDYAALALREDLTALRAERAFFNRWSHRIGYVPRGADPLLLHPGQKVGRRPVIGVDTPSTGDRRTVQHYHRPLKRLRREFDGLEVISLGRGMGLKWATTVPRGRFDQMYDQFFNRAWLYLTIDHKAIDDVQSIEAQMAGAVVVGHASTMIPELFDPGESGVLFRDFDDADELFDRMAGVIDAYDHHRAAARAWALRHHDWEQCIAMWRNGLRDLVDNGYTRNSGPFPSSRVASTNASAPKQAPATSAAKQLKPWMSEAEQEFFLRYVHGATAIVEYGSGGSTLAALQSPAARIYSVDSDESWLRRLAGDPMVARAVAGGRLTLVHVDLGPTGAWGYPETDARRAEWPKYAEEVWLHHVRQPIDFVLIDGRFRVYAAAFSLSRLSPDAIVLVHDFWDREHYHGILALAEVIDRCETFVALRPKAGAVNGGMAAMERFTFDPR